MKWKYSYIVFQKEEITEGIVFILEFTINGEFYVISRHFTQEFF